MARSHLLRRPPSSSVLSLVPKALWSLTLPAAWAGLVLALALSVRRRGLAPAVALVACAPLASLTLPPVVSPLQRAVAASAEDTFRPGVEYDAAIVLGGNRYRVEAGAEVVRRGQARYLLYSGALDELGSRALRSRLAELGVPDDRIVIEPRSRNTREEAVASARVVAARRWSSLLLVTGAGHASRAAASFRRLGLRPDVLPVHESVKLTGASPSALALEQAAEALHELAGRIAYRVLGYTDAW